MVCQGKSENSRTAGLIGGLLGVILMIGLNQVECAANVLFATVARVALGALPEVLVRAWHVVQAVNSCNTAPLWEQVLQASGSWLPMIAALVAKV